MFGVAEFVTDPYRRRIAPVDQLAVHLRDGHLPLTDGGLIPGVFHLGPGRGHVQPPGAVSIEAESRIGRREGGVQQHVGGAGAAFDGRGRKVPFRFGQRGSDRVHHQDAPWRGGHGIAAEQGLLRGDRRIAEVVGDREMVGHIAGNGRGQFDGGLLGPAEGHLQRVRGPADRDRIGLVRVRPQFDGHALRAGPRRRPRLDVIEVMSEAARLGADHGVDALGCRIGQTGAGRVGPHGALSQGERLLVAHRRVQHAVLLDDLQRRGWRIQGPGLQQRIVRIYGVQLLGGQVLIAAHHHPVDRGARCERARAAQRGRRDGVVAPVDHRLGGRLAPGNVAEPQPAAGDIGDPDAHLVAVGEAKRGQPSRRSREILLELVGQRCARVQARPAGVAAQVRQRHRQAPSAPPHHDLVGVQSAVGVLDRGEPLDVALLAHPARDRPRGPDQHAADLVLGIPFAQRAPGIALPADVDAIAEDEILRGELGVGHVESGPGLDGLGPLGEVEPSPRSQQGQANRAHGRHRRVRLRVGCQVAAGLPELADCTVDVERRQSPAGWCGWYGRGGRCSDRRRLRQVEQSVADAGGRARRGPESGGRRDEIEVVSGPGCRDQPR